MPPPLVIGIDLGTTHTVVAWAELAEDAEPRVFNVPQLVDRASVASRALLPSFLYAPLPEEREDDPWGDAPWIVGEQARRRGREVPGRLVASAKSWLSHAAVDRTAAILPWGAPDDARELPRISPVEASARILGHVRSSWNRTFPSRPLEKQQVVLTVPASFDQAARELTVRAAADAGLAVRLLEEPQAAFYDTMRRLGLETFEALLGDDASALVLVCDVGGGTTDLTLIRVARTDDDAVDVTRVAVGRHLLLGGDNVDLALAHVCEARLVQKPKRLEPQPFGQLVLACREAKETLLAADAPDAVPIRILGSGSALVGSTLSTSLSREEVEKVVLDGFLPEVKRDEKPKRGARAGLVAFGLPYEHDPAITRHLAAFFDRHAPEEGAPRALLYNGGLFHAPPVSGRIADVVGSWTERSVDVLPQPDPDLAVARGAVTYGLALGGFGLTIGGGTAHGYYVALGAADTRNTQKALCVVPRGAKEGERHTARAKGLSLVVGKPVRFELFASDAPGVHAPGAIVDIDDETFELLPPIAVSFDEGGSEERVPVALEGELTAVGTVDLACVETDAEAGRQARRFELAFDLRGAEGEAAPRSRRSEAPKSTVQKLGQRFDEATEALQRVFGKGRKDVKEREAKDVLRNLERILGDRPEWDLELCRALFDVVGPKHKARKRSADHERMYWLLAGYCLRPGFGHALDPSRIRVVAPLFDQAVTFGKETRCWEMFFIAWRRFAGGLDETRQTSMRDLTDPYLAPASANRKKPKGFKPQPVRQMLETASWLERVPVERKRQLGEWILEQTWTSREAQLWEALGRLGARVPAYASVHHVVPPRVVAEWLDHLLRDDWSDLRTAPRAAMMMARMTGDRTRDAADATREQVASRLEKEGAREEWVRSVREIVEVDLAERAEMFGEELPVGLVIGAT